MVFFTCTNYYLHIWFGCSKLQCHVISGGPKKQPVVIEICDDEDACIWCDDDEKPSLKSDALGSGEPGTGSYLYQV